MLFLNCTGPGGTTFKVLPLLLRNLGPSAIHVKKIYLINQGQHCNNNTTNIPNVTSSTGQYTSHLWYFHLLHVNSTPFTFSEDTLGPMSIETTPNYSNITNTYHTDSDSVYGIPQWAYMPDIDYAPPFPYTWETNWDNGGESFAVSAPRYRYKIRYPFDLFAANNDVFRIDIVMDPRMGHIGFPSSQFPEGGAIQGEHEAKLVIEAHFFDHNEGHIDGTETGYEYTFRLKVKFDKLGVQEIDVTDLDNVTEIDHTGLFNILDLKG